jgi:hypothetical protein
MAKVAPTYVKIVNFDESVVSQAIQGESHEFDLTIEELEHRIEFKEGGGGGCGSCGGPCSCGSGCVCWIRC